MEIIESEIKGLGPKKIAALRGIGIVTAKDLAEVDLRTFQGMEGISKENLKVLKGRARAVCRREGIAFEKAAYAASKTKKAVAPRPTARAKSAKKKGLLGRLLRN